VSEVAYSVGFQSLTQFNRLFRRMVGTAPTGYRGHLAPERPPGRVPTRGDHDGARALNALLDAVTLR
jgi:AraC-like DNA-binding protein